MDRSASAPDPGSVESALSEVEPRGTSLGEQARRVAAELEEKARELDEDFPDDSKGSNPKDAIGSRKTPMGLMPDTAVVAGNMAFLEGAMKYGRYNWRAVGVRASIYVEALRRHLSAWWNGEDIDEDSGLSHLWKAMACLAVLIDAEAVGKLNDDRPPRAPVQEMLDDLRPHVEDIKDRYADRTPHQYTIQDDLEGGADG